MMKQKNLTKTTSATVSVIMLSCSLMVVPSAHAVTPDNGAAAIPAIGGNSGREFFNMKAALGWGYVGATNTLITAVTGASKGQVTRAAVQSICGSGAAGVFANWKPAAGPTTLAAMKAIAKGGAVAATGSFCGWATQGTLALVNKYSPAADSFFNGAPPATKNATNTQVRNAQIDLTNINNALAGAAAARDSILNATKYYNDNRCSTFPSQRCQSISNEITYFSAQQQSYLTIINNAGKDLEASLKNINNLIKS